MRILFITNNFPPVIDGVGDYTYNIAKQFFIHGHEVYVVCKNNLKINTKVNGITILPIINEWSLGCYKSIVKLVHEKKIDVVSLQYVPHSFHPKGLPFFLIKLSNEIKKSNAILFTFLHEVSVESEKGNIKRIFLSKLMQYISKRIIDNSDYVATSIEYYRKMILKLVPDKENVPLIPIASNIPETKLSDTELKAFKKKLAPNDETIIAFFGIRKINTSIDAVSELLNEGYKLKILIIGKTSTAIPKNLPNQTIKTGALEIEEIDKYFKVSDIFILPQDNIYGCSFKSGSFVAGLRNKLPTITAKGKMTSNLLMDKKNILFTDFDNKEEIKKSIMLLLNKNAASQIGSEAFSIVKNISWENTFNQYIDILK